MLKVQNLTKTFKSIDKNTKQKKKVGIFDVSFDVENGQVFGLIGPNGAGKTTTMRILSGLTSPHSGQVLLNDVEYKNIKDLKSKVVFVSGETQIFDRLTPREILKIFGELAGVEKNILNQRIEDVSQKLLMQDFLDKQVQNFSTGMKQKVSLARALVVDPEVYIFDEVTSGLDIFAAKAVKDVVKELKKVGKIIVYSTHIMPEADELCDEFAIIHKGKILETGLKNNLMEKYDAKNAEDMFFKILKSQNQSE